MAGFTPPPARPRPSGEYTSMTDMKKLGETLYVTEVLDDDANAFKGENKPRFLVKGTLADADEPILVSVSKGYSRDDFLVALQEYLETSDEPQGVRFVATQGSAYIDIIVAE